MSTSDHQTERASTFPPSGDVEFRHLRPALGTFVAVSGKVADARNVRPGVEAAYDAIERVGALMHPTRNDSDLTSIRTSPIGRAIAIHRWTWEVLCWSQRLNALSGGRFDPCVPESAGRIRDIDLPAPGVVVCRAPARSISVASRRASPLTRGRRTDRRGLQRRSSQRRWRRSLFRAGPGDDLAAHRRVRPADPAA